MESQAQYPSSPAEVIEIETAWIPLSDGCRLAARIWLPAHAEERPVGAVMEYIPYRRRDLSRMRDEPMHRYFAEHGYASLRVDLRGSGDSSGLLEDEYTRQEWEDGVEAIAWIAAQPWCNGSVGMIGLSWGGFTALQIAALRPSALKAIITVGSTDDRYRDDMHFTGGCLIDDQMEWGTGFLCYLSLPPDPEVVGDEWRQMWRSRLEHMFPPVHRWLRHQWRDPYWRHGSVCEDFNAIEAAVYAVGGWADGYSNAVFRMIEGLAAPRRATVGPWGHLYPHEGVPGPAVGFLQDALRWWERWLDGVDNGVMDEAACRLWMQEWVRPVPFHAERPGRWVATEGWPPGNTEAVTFHLSGNGLREEPGGEKRLKTSSPQTLGIAAGEWYGKGYPTGEPLDQRVDDAFSLCFDTEPLSERFELLGAPALELHLDCDRPVALVAVCLNDVAPDGSSLRVSYGVLNLTHREGHEAPTPLVPDERFTARIKLDHIAHAFAPGHRIRIAISTAYWPLAWPSPEVVTLGVHCGRSTLILPRLECGTESPALHPFEAPRRARAMNREVHRLGRSTRTVVEDVASGEVRVIEIRDLGDYCISDIGLRFRERPLRHCPIAMTAAIALKGNAGSSESLVELPEIPIRSRPPRLGAAARSVRGTARPPNAPAAPSAALRARKARRVVAPIPEVAGSATRSRGIDPELEASFFVFIALSPLGARGPRTPDYTAPQWPARALIRRDATGRRHRDDGIRFPLAVAAMGLTRGLPPT